MATYVCSDLHGHYNIFMKLLEAIKFSERDEMYILGDIIDKGDKSLALIDFIRKQRNMKCLLGNHENDFLRMYRFLMKGEERPDLEKVLKELKEYFPNDDYPLTWDIVRYIENMSFVVDTKHFVGVHAGLELDKYNRIASIVDQRVEFVVSDRHFKDVEVVNDLGKPVLFGHTPCNYDNQTGHFIKYPDCKSTNILDYVKIRLDTGVQYTHMLGVLRIEDMKEIYVRRVNLQHIQK